jgi:hypothetical protein
MATFTVDIDYNILEVVEVDQDNVSVEFTLSCTEADLEETYTELYPKAMYYQNIDPTMDESDLQTQMRGNFLTISKSTFEAFANECKNKIKQTQGTIGDVDLSGTVAMNTTVIYITFGKKLNSFTVMWFE